MELRRGPIAVDAKTQILLKDNVPWSRRPASNHFLYTDESVSIWKSIQG